MKNTIRVRKNRSASRPRRQVKIPDLTHFTLVITDEATGEIQSKFEIPHKLYDAMVASALKQGVSVQQVFEAAVTKEMAIPATLQTPFSNPVSLIFFDLEGGTSIGSGIDLTPGEFAAIKKEASECGKTLDDWLCQVIDNAVHQKSIHEAQWVAMSGFEDKYRQVNTVLNLVLDRYIEASEKLQEHSVADKSFYDSFDAGLLLLVGDTCKQLKQAFDTCWDASFPNKKEVSA